VIAGDAGRARHAGDRPLACLHGLGRSGEAANSSLCPSRLNKRHYFRYRSSRHRRCDPLADLIAQRPYRAVVTIHIASGHCEVLVAQKIPHEEGVRAGLASRAAVSVSPRPWTLDAPLGDASKEVNRLDGWYDWAIGCVGGSGARPALIYDELKWRSEVAGSRTFIRWGFFGD
jgi:hypothetical protein